MILFYGMGGGWGHLTRIKRFIETKPIQSDFKVLTSNSDAELFFPKESIIYIPADRNLDKESLATQIKSLLKSVRFSACYVDVFPNGILGELSDSIIDASCFHYLGRRLRWEQYLPLFDEPIHFETAFLFEELEEAHFSYIASHSSSVLEVELGYGSADPSFDHPLISQEKPIWLIVHSSNVQEVTMLVDHAVDVASIEQVQPHFVVLSKEELNRSDVTILTDQDPIDWFPIADRIFSGAGFNTWNQLTSWREKHVCLPLQRRFDDQYWRSQQ